MPKNEHSGVSGKAYDSAIPTMTIKIPMPANVKPPAKVPFKDLSRREASTTEDS